MLNLVDNELSFAPWQAVATKAFAQELATKFSANDVSIIAVDGRSAGGKTTLADKLASALPNAVHQLGTPLPHGCPNIVIGLG